MEYNHMGNGKGWAPKKPWTYVQLRKNVLVGGLNPPEKYAQVKLDHETPGTSRGENKKCLKPPPGILGITSKFQIWSKSGLFVDRIPLYFNNTFCGAGVGGGVQAKGG